MAGPLLTDGINLRDSAVDAQNAPSGGEESVTGAEPHSQPHGDPSGGSEPLAVRLESMTIPEIEKAIEEGEFTAQEAADTEATFDEPRVGVLSLGTN